MTRKWIRLCTVVLALVVLTTSAVAEITTLAEFLDGERVAVESVDEANPLDDIIEESAVKSLPEEAPAKPDGLVLVLCDGPAGDFVFARACTAKLDVATALRESSWPQPIDFAKAKVCVRRPQAVVNDDLSVDLEEKVFSVTWDAKTGRPTVGTNHSLQPGDHLVVELPGAKAPQLEAATAATRAYQPAPASTEWAARPVAIAAPPELAATPQPIARRGKRVIRYSAIPAAVPSPFDGSNESTAPYVSSNAVPLPAPPAVQPAAQWMDAPPDAQVAQPRAANVRFDIVVIEDLDSSLNEFEQLQAQRFILTDSPTFRGTLHILEKRELVKRLAEPKLTVVADGEKGSLEIGARSTNAPQQGLKLDVAARELGGGLMVDFGFANSTGEQVNQVRTSLIVPHGQTVVMKTGQPRSQESGDRKLQRGAEHAVYVVLTPEIVR